MTLTHAFILSFVEGVTEFLPISSTGHLILVSSILEIEQTEFVKSFEIAIQLGAILAVAVLYARKFFLNRRLTKLVAVSFLPAAVLGLVFYKFIKGFLIGNTGVTLWALFVGGIILIFWEKKKVDLFQKSLRATAGSAAISGIATSSRPKVGTPRNDVSGLTTYSALKIGLFQTVSMIPGVSRAGATIIGGMAAGLSRVAAVEFSFLLAIPTMAAATGLDLLKSYQYFSGQDVKMLAIGFILSFISAKIAVEWLIKFMKSHSLAAFGVYRIVLAIAFWTIIK